MKASFDGFGCSSNGKVGFMDGVVLAIGVNVVAIGVVRGGVGIGVAVGMVRMAEDFHW